MTHPFLNRDQHDVPVDIRTDCAGFADMARLMATYAPFRGAIRQRGVEVAFAETRPLAPFAKGELAADLATLFAALAHAGAGNLGGAIPWPNILIGNCAPRDEGTANAHGCPFVLATMPGLIYLGTGMSELSFVKPHVTGLWVLDIPTHGTQFRSRYLGQALGRFLTFDASVLKNRLSLDQIPEPNYLTVARVDAMGNINLNMPQDHEFFADHKFGERVEITINGIRCYATYCSGIGGESAAKVGSLILTPGSLSYDPANASRRNMDLQFVIGPKRRGAAACRFASPQGVELLGGLPVGGDEVSISWAPVTADELAAQARI